MKVEWSVFKAVVGSRSLAVYYFFDGAKYNVFAKDGYFEFESVVDNPSDKQEFEQRYKQAANSYPPSITNQLGRASAAKQDTGNASLASIDGKLNSLGQKTQAGSVPIVVSSDPTYSAGVSSLNVANSATDVFTITGSASKVIRVKRIEVFLTVNVALGGSQTIEVVLAKRSTANSGGTSTTPTVVPHDSTDSAGTAVVRAYTANPTLGSLVGAVRCAKITAVSVNTTAPVARQVWDFGLPNSKPIYLRGTSEVLAVNLNGNTLTSDDNAINIEWDEL